jgi:hypothetical protein
MFYLEIPFFLLIWRPQGGFRRFIRLHNGVFSCREDVPCRVVHDDGGPSAAVKGSSGHDYMLKFKICLSFMALASSE